MGIVLRPYQESFVKDIGEAFKRYRRVCGVASTGAGKTVVFSYMAKGAAAKNNDVLIMAHRARIIGQISKSLRDQGIRHGRIQRGYTQTNDIVQVGMVLTIGNRLKRIRPPKFIIVDEGHHAVAAAYRKIFAAFPDAKILLMTATPDRADRKGLKAVADVLVEAISMKELIALKALAPYKYLAPPQLADLSAVRDRGGDYAVDELAEAMNKAIITGSAIDHYKKYVPGLGAVVFCVNVQHAKDVAAQFNAAGIRAESVDGTMDEKVVDKYFDLVERNIIKVITSCDLISEGVDVKGLYAAFLLTRTKSVTKFMQMVGRVLRKKEDGGYAWLFDHVGNYILHGFPDADREWSLEGKKKKTENVLEFVKCGSCPKVFEKFPGWRAKQKPCEDADSECALVVQDKETGTRRAPEEQAGELREISDAPTWAPGISISNAKGDDFKRLVSAARSDEQLLEIARIRGFKHGWVKHIMESRTRA